MTRRASRPWTRGWIACAVIVVAQIGCSLGRTIYVPDNGSVEDCSAAGDEDGNGLADCDDPVCAGLPSCHLASPIEEDCSVPGDEDSNGRADCDDPVCASLPSCQQPHPSEDCSAPGDEDNNGLADCADPACAGLPPCAGQPRPTVTVVALGAGTITATVGDLVCDQDCLASLDEGELIQVFATPDADSWFRGWITGCDSGRTPCEVVSTAGLVITGDFRAMPNRIFISSTTSNGNFGGISGGNAACQRLADQAGLDGAYRILLGTPTSDWHHQLDGARGWIRVDGQPVVDQGASLGEGSGQYNIRLDENGNEAQGNADYWAGSVASSSSTAACSGWTSAAVALSAFSLSATRAAAFSVAPDSMNCATQLRFLCAEVDRNVQVTPAPAMGRIAFTTTGLWTPSTGIDRADAMCSAEAAGAQLSGSFKALLATTSASAISRFNTSGRTWTRLDGLPLLPTARSFELGHSLDVAPGVRLDGTVAISNLTIPVGAPDLHSVATSASSCGNWLLKTGSASAFGAWETSPNRWPASCGTPWPVLCLQE